MEHDFEWFLQHTEAYDSLTPDQIHVLGNGGTIEYSTAPADPAAAVDPAVVEPVAVEPKSEEAGSDPKVVAKNGKDLIPFSELEDARAKAAQYEALTKEQADLIASLQAAKKADSNTGDTAAQEDVLKDFKEQYPDIAATLLPALQKFIDDSKGKTAELERKFTEALTPIQESAQDAQVTAHFKAIGDAHSDYKTLIDSGNVDDWIKAMPSYLRPAASRVLDEGTADEVIELLTQYKKENGVGESKAAPAEGMSKDEVAAKAAAAVSKAKGGKPVSLSDVPSGVGKIDDSDPTTVEGWSRRFAGKTPEQIMAEL